MVFLQIIQQRLAFGHLGQVIRCHVARVGGGFGLVLIYLVHVRTHRSLCGSGSGQQVL